MKLVILPLFCLTTLYVIPQSEAVVGMTVTAATVVVLKWVGAGVGAGATGAVGTKIVESFSKNGCWPIGIDDRPTVSMYQLVIYRYR